MDKVGKKYSQDSSQYAPHEIEFGYKAVYRPRNFGHSYSNQQVTLREAIVRSLNVVAVDAAMRVGLENVAEMSARLGLPRPRIYSSIALGAFETTPLDIARAYTTFANDGVRVDPLAIGGDLGSLSSLAASSSSERRNSRIFNLPSGQRPVASALRLLSALSTTRPPGV